MPFHAATENMAALLRLARLLKFTPSGLVQITGTKRNGLPLSRLYSGTLGSRRNGVCSRHIGPAVENAPSLFLLSRLSPYTVGCVRNCAVHSEQKDELSSGVYVKQTQQLDSARFKLDDSVRKTGRISKTLLFRVFQDVCKTGFPSDEQALLLLRSCGFLLPELLPADRIELAHHIWEKLGRLGLQYDVTHYNAILKVYLHNEYKFSPTDFLARMEAANVPPNRVTYQRLIAAYCQNGDIEGVSTILGFMKSKDLPITEAVFNALVTGHARAGNIDSSKDIFTVMQKAGIQPSTDTYVALVIAYAEKGDFDNVKKTLEEAEKAHCSFMDQDILQVIFTLAMAGHQQHVPEMLERMNMKRHSIPDGMNLCLRLITHGQDDVAYQVLKSFPQTYRISPDFQGRGNFFLRHCVNMNTDSEKLVNYCRDLQESNLHTSPFNFSLFCALQANNIGLSFALMKQLKEQNLPVRTHFFRPLFAPLVKDTNKTGVVEVIKTMKELGVAIDEAIFIDYIVPTIGDWQQAKQALKDIGVSVKIEDASSHIFFLASDDLAMFYTKLLDYSFSSLDFDVFYSHLICGFIKSSDIESMVKITEFLHKKKYLGEKRFKDTERTGYLLYNLIKRMTKEEVQAQEDKLKGYFKELKALNLTIPVNYFRGIWKILAPYNVQELIQDVAKLVYPNDTETALIAGIHGALPLDNMETLEKRQADQELPQSTNKVILDISKLCANDDLQGALKLKQMHEEQMTSTGYAILIKHCCLQNNVEEALNLKREMSLKDSSAVLHSHTYIALMKLFAMNGKMEEALNVLKEMKKKDVVMTDRNVISLTHVLNSVAAQGNPAVVRRLQETIFALGLAKPSSTLCKPLVMTYLDSNDLSGALEAVLECLKHYNCLPHFHEILVGLIQEGETELLQKAMESVSQTRGEMTMLYDLFFALLQTGHYHEASKIIKTPGLRAKHVRLQWFAEKCLYNNQMETLEHLVDMTAKLFECNRDLMYQYLFRLYKNTENWEKAGALWTKMQEENVTPGENTLQLLSDALRNDGKNLHFEVPESWYEQPKTPEPVKQKSKVRSQKDQDLNVLKLCKKGKAEEAFKLVKNLDIRGEKLLSGTYDQLIRALLSQGLLDDALALKRITVSNIPTFQWSESAMNLLIVSHSKKDQLPDALEILDSMVKTNYVPSQLAISKLLQALCMKGDVAGIKNVMDMMKGLGVFPKRFYFQFKIKIALAYINMDEVDSAVEVLESMYTDPDSSVPNISSIFRRVIEDGNDKVLDKLSVMAERLANHFACYRPAVELFLELLDKDRVEDAKFMLARCNGMAEQRNQLVSFMVKMSRVSGQVGKILTLLDLIPDFAEKDVVYTYLMKCHVQDDNIPAIEALLKKMQEEGVEVNELSRKRLAHLYLRHQRTPPFPEPMGSFRFFAQKLNFSRKGPGAAEN